MVPKSRIPIPVTSFITAWDSTGGLRGRKRSLYLGGVGTPLIVRWPGHVPAGRVDTTTVLSGVDFFPTLLAAAGLTPPSDYQPDGENVLEALRGENLDREKPIFWQWRGNHGQPANWPVRGMRQGPWSLLTDDFVSRIELHHVMEIGSRDRNLAPRYPDRVQSMLEQIRLWESSLPDDPPIANPIASDGKSGSRSPKRPAIDRGAVFDRKDKNGDQRLTLEEYLDRFPDPDEGRRRFPKFDTNGDGTLSREEYK